MKTMIVLIVASASLACSTALLSGGRSQTIKLRDDGYLTTADGGIHKYARGSVTAKETRGGVWEATVTLLRGAPKYT